MRLELAAYPVEDVRFGASTRWHDRVLEIDRDEIPVQEIEPALALMRERRGWTA